MKKFFVVLVLAVALVGCCTHPAEVGALGHLETEVDVMSGKYLKYVDADPMFGGAALTPEQRVKARENERAWTGTVKGIATSVKNSLGK
jgi:hypothetical protein